MMSPIINRTMIVAVAAIIACGGAAVWASPQDRSGASGGQGHGGSGLYDTGVRSDAVCQTYQCAGRWQRVTLDGYVWTPEEMQAAVQDAKSSTGRRQGGQSHAGRPRRHQRLSGHPLSVLDVIGWDACG